MVVQMMDEQVLVEQKSEGVQMEKRGGKNNKNTEIGRGKISLGSF